MHSRQTGAAPVAPPDARDPAHEGRLAPEREDEVTELQLTEDQKAELRAELCGGEKASSDVRIVILQRGWVMVGRYLRAGDDCALTNCSVIRLWGTTKGLGEIAEGGPTSKTVLDKCPTARFHALTIVASLDCVESKWRKHL